MDDEDLARILLNLNTVKLSWHQPWQGFTMEGKSKDAYVMMTATAADCILMRRDFYRQMNKHSSMSNEDVLAEFIIVNWAYEEK